ncbi:MaoC family dehydratase N-terminal domain-containing protein [Kutzneria buriramensis]|uniref:UPF0336 protein BCF44_106201 n=1 Tax=Kutzneria buriramensis TaxID=1045776 RepID=A0A3E0HKU9_9PSEU|nr:MaoC family dehydratase N-terminal domain-containing protein [Kutzneria buriramensis]REH47037.1 acyl dehydratase [Kutzneria buriramensis]
MAIDAGFVGRTYPPTAPYLVGREKIREFARATGQHHPLHHDLTAAGALGHHDLLAPPTFAIVLTMSAEGQAIFDPALGLDFSRVVHRSQQFTHSRPIHAGDLLSVTVTVAAVDSVGGNDVLTLSSRVATVQGDQVCTAVSTLVARAA